MVIIACDICYGSMFLDKKKMQVHALLCYLKIYKNRFHIAESVQQHYGFINSY